ncbi:MAG: pyridoxamine 5'-phosphate oxidase [Porticoccaceae bacterium]|nr:pyridoxamine 5'-phosphate oxidase [Porticoccaceae bacterium]
MALESERREYQFGRLTRESLADCPFEQFEHWMQQALESDIKDPTAMSVATADTDGRPWQRMVLLKAFDERGFVFYTNLGSRKAREIAHNPQVSLHFPWVRLDRQVIVGGRAEPLPKTEVLSYFLKRPAESQLGAWASRQSTPISSRQILEAEFQRLKDKFSKGKIPLPDFWGGFRVVPEAIEFWQGGNRRLHDRFYYQRDENGQWRVERLAP